MLQIFLTKKKVFFGAFQSKLAIFGITIKLIQKTVQIKLFHDEFFLSWLETHAMESLQYPLEDYLDSLEFPFRNRHIFKQLFLRELLSFLVQFLDYFIKQDQAFGW